MKLYSQLDKIGPARRSYSFKFLLVAFIGIHLPIIALVASLMFLDLTDSKWMVVLIVLGMTLAASVLTLGILKKLTMPLEVASQGVDFYRRERKLPDWEFSGTDEMSRLLQNIRQALEELEMHRIHHEDLSMLLSHDLRAPITAAIQTIELNKVEDDAEQITKNMDELQEYLENQLAFVDLILQLQKNQSVEQGQFQLDALNLRTIVSEVLSGYRPVMEAKNLSVEIAEFDFQIIGNRNMTRQCISNLLQNAVKYSFHGGLITVRAEFTEDHLIKLHISDDGIGFEETHLSGLFDRNKGKGQTGTDGEKSYGLGLYLTHTLMRNQQGDVTALSAGRNQGATFTLVFRSA